jgi:putative tricarboxylic transport membrane protein
MTQSKAVDKGIKVYNVPGAGGTIGLSQLSSKQAGKSNQLMVMGLVMMGAIETNKSPVDLSKTTPIAALTTEPEAIFVRADSKYETLQDLLDDMKADPSKSSFGGGSAGGTEQILLGLVAKAAGVDPSKPKYVAYSGGGEAQQSILSGSVDAGISTISEWADQVEAGKMRMLAVSTPEPIDVAGKQVKTLKDQGIDVGDHQLARHRRAPDIKPAERDAAIAAMKKLHDSDEWQAALKKNGWTDFFKPGDESSRSWTRRTRG